MKGSVIDDDGINVQEVTHVGGVITSVQILCGESGTTTERYFAPSPLYTPPKPVGVGTPVAFGFIGQVWHHDYVVYHLTYIVSYYGRRS